MCAAMRTSSRAGRNTTLVALAMGGSLHYRSGWLLDRLQIGAALFTSQKLLVASPFRMGTDGEHATR